MKKNLEMRKGALFGIDALPTLTVYLEGSVLLKPVPTVDDVRDAFMSSASRPEQAVFDEIMATAAAMGIPEDYEDLALLIEQHGKKLSYIEVTPSETRGVDIKVVSLLLNEGAQIRDLRELVRFLQHMLLEQGVINNEQAAAIMTAFVELMAVTAEPPQPEPGLTPDMLS